MKGKEAYETCAICLEEFENADMIRVLPCSHSKSHKFKKICIIGTNCCHQECTLLFTYMDGEYNYIKIKV